MPNLFNKMKLSHFITSCFLLTLAIPADSIDSNTWYKLTTQWQGAGKSLDVVNDGVWTGQWWTMVQGKMSVCQVQ